ncbi:PPA1309 family protein [Gordonia sp. NPDC003422]
MTPRRFSPDALGSAMREVIDHTAGLGAQPAVFALVPTSVLAELEPGLVADDDASELSPVQQEIDDPDEFLATAAWPEAVTGAVLTTQITVAPPADAASRQAEQPARLAVGVLRDGPRLAMMRLLTEPASDELLTHPDLAVDLVEALAATFEPDAS